MNQPTVRDRSTSSNSSSRPWPSRSTRHAPGPVHGATACASAVSSTSLICVRYAAGTSCSSACVSASVSATSTVSADAAVFSPPA